MQDGVNYKGYNVKMLGTFPMVEIKAKGQGKIPKPLEGLFTTKTAAMTAIDMYLQSLTKGKRNGKTKGTGTG